MKKHEVIKIQYGSSPTTFKGCKTWMATEGQWGEGGKVGDSRYFGLAVILKIGLEWAVRGLPLPQSLAGTGRRVWGESSCQCEGLACAKSIRTEPDLHPRAE